MIARAGVAAVVACAGWSAVAIAAFAPSQTTKFSGTTSAGSTITRTIIDISGPDSPTGGDRVANHLSVSLTIGAGLAPPAVAAAFEAACDAQLGPSGFDAMLCTPVTVVLTNTNSIPFDISDVPDPNISMVPGACPFALPGTSPLGLISLAIALSALACWELRRRVAA
jgi:hypothetical protein